jgi:hypothetical protein
VKRPIRDVRRVVGSILPVVEGSTAAQRLALDQARALVDRGDALGLFVLVLQPDGEVVAAIECQSGDPVVKLAVRGALMRLAR